MATDELSEKQQQLLERITWKLEELKSRYQDKTLEQTDDLNKKQKELLEEIVDIQKRIKRRHHGKTPEENRAMRGYQALCEERNDLMRRALRMGLKDHPLVHEWLVTVMLFGIRELLGKAKKPDGKKDFATGVKRPLPMIWVKLAAEIEEIVREEKWTKLKAEIEEIVTAEKKKSEKPVSREAVRRKLESTVGYKASPQRFHKLIIELGLQDLFI